ncbi:MAG TPA: chloride channel protein [Acidimicrobiales bacterium]|nr:chloride channel protein [Acidimicrobiales bacterium]
MSQPAGGPPAPTLPATARTHVRFLATSASRWLRSTTYLRKWLVLGSLLGCIAGLGAVTFYEALTLATHLFLGVLAGYQVPTPAGEGLLAGSASLPRPWLIPLVVGAGGLLSGLLVFTLAPEAEGHGTDAAIEAVHDNPRGVRTVTVGVKIVASALTIGSGGSGGREGPTAQISAGFGSFLARALDLSPSDGRIAVAVGIGSGIGSIFGAPLGGALLSAEILYRDDIEVEAIIPSIIASIIGYTVFSAFMGFSPLFGYAAPSYHYTQPLQLAWYALIGIVGGFVGLGYAKGFYGITDLFRKLPLPRATRPAVGGLMVGAMAVALPEVLGTGYGWIQKGLGPQLMSLPLWVVLAMPAAKIVATSFSIGSGGSGGIFGPGMVIGAFTGAAVWRLLEPVAPAIPHTPAPFVVVGMMATFGGIARAPLAVMLMVVEMTGSLATLAPAMIAVGLATLIVRRADDTIYRSQLHNRAESAAHRLQARMPLLSSLRVAEFMARPKVIFSGRNTVGEGAGKLAREGLPGAPVVDEREAFVGVVRARELADMAGQSPDTELGRVADPTAPTVSVDATLDVALESLMQARSNWIPVLGDHREVVGIMTTSSLVRGYRAGLQGNLRRMSQVSADAAVVDGTVGAGAPLAGVPLRSAGLPVGTIVMTVQRGTEQVLPGGDTVLEPGDRVGILTRRADQQLIERLLGRDSLDPSVRAS